MTDTQTQPTKFYQKTWFRYLRDITLVLLVITGVGLFQTRNLLATKTPAPTWKLHALDGTPHTLAQYKGKKTLLFFWAPWCTVCHLESDNIKAIKRFYGQDVHVVSVALAYEKTPDVQAFIKKHDIDYTVLLGNKTTQRAYNISAFPTLYVLDEQLRVEHTIVGYTTQLGMHLRLWF